MDISKIFEPVQKFTTYLVDRVSLILISYFVITYVTDQSVLEYSKQAAAFYQLPSGFLESFGIKGDNQTVFVVVVALLVLVAVLEIHEKILRLLKLFSPVHFSTHSYHGQDAFTSYAHLLWRGYCRQLDLSELQNLFQITVTKLQIDSQPRVRRTEVFDFIPAWIFLLLLLLVFHPKGIVISDFGVLKFALLLLFVGLVWELYQGQDLDAEAYRVHNLAVATLIEKKLHDFEELTERQREQLAAHRKAMGSFSRPWRVSVLRFPWISFAKSVVSFARSRIEYRISRGWPANSWFATLLRIKPRSRW